MSGFREEEWLGKVQIGETADGAFPFQVLKFTASIDPASVAAATTAGQNFTFTGLKAGDIPVALEVPSAMESVAWVPVRVSADNTLRVTGTNATAAAIDIAAGQSCTVTVLRPKPFA